uniref:Uncharacterized protein n=1 Tax=Rhodnius prolixus TaxID=13249 RepID=T1I0K5_RHOPR
MAAIKDFSTTSGVVTLAAVLLPAYTILQVGYSCSGKLRFFMLLMKR